MTARPLDRAAPMLCGTPHLARYFDDELQLGDLVGDGEIVAFEHAGKAALRRERKLLERTIFRRRVDAPLQIVLALELRAFAGDEAEHDGLALGDKAQRREIAGARAVVLEEIPVDIDVVEQ